jgi:hypothetical protein
MEVDLGTLALTYLTHSGGAGLAEGDDTGNEPQGGQRTDPPAPTPALYTAVAVEERQPDQALERSRMILVLEL